MPTVLIAVAVAVVLIAVIVALYYNRLISLRNRYQQAFSQIDVQLKRRYDLIPNVVETARGYMKHERGTLEAVATARANAVAAVKSAEAHPGQAAIMRDLGSADLALTGALSRLLFHWEAYPDLKANQTMANLMEELTTTENRIALARQAYNDAVMFYNTALQTLPTSLLARLFGFLEAGFFVIENATDRQLPQVEFAHTHPDSTS